VEVSGQLSNQAIKERVNALLSLTRDNVPATSLGETSPECQPTVRTPERICRRLGPDQVEELIQGYIDGVPVDELAARFQVPSRGTPDALPYPVDRPGWGRGSPSTRHGFISAVSRWSIPGQAVRALRCGY